MDWIQWWYAITNGVAILLAFYKIAQGEGKEASTHTVYTVATITAIGVMVPGAGRIFGWW